MTLVMATGSEFQTVGDKVNSVISGGMAGFMNRSLNLGLSVFASSNMGLNHEEWFTRVWTYQEAVFSNVITYVTFDGKHYSLPEELIQAIDIEKSPYEETTRMDLVAAVGKALMEKKFGNSLVTTMYRSCLRQCTREQDRVFGIVSLLENATLKVDYGKSMEVLNREIVEWAALNRDLSWLSVGGNAREEGFLQPMYKPFTYVGFRWEEEYDWSESNKNIFQIGKFVEEEEDDKKFEEESKKEFEDDEKEYKLEFIRKMKEDFNERFNETTDEYRDKFLKAFGKEYKEKFKQELSDEELEELLMKRKDDKEMARLEKVLADGYAEFAFEFTVTFRDRQFKEEFNKKSEEEFEKFKKEKLKEISQEILEKEKKMDGSRYLDLQMCDMAKVIYFRRAASKELSFGFEDVKKFGISTNDISYVLVDCYISDKKDYNTIAKTIDDAKAENKEGKFPLLIDGDVQEGDKILRLPMVDDLKRTLCIVSIAATSPNIFKRKGVCLYKEFKVESDNYSTYRYIL
ncbi:hypothetical protein BGZ76_002741 [Entomortierella beljakovae]|nr:hypothetical protein BGZ76_002741 [Entomortierella beljakovae]